MNTKAILLETRSLGVARGPRILLTDLNFALSPGQLCVVTGPNGAGKSSLLRVLAGLALPSGGQALWRGRPMETLTLDRNGEIAYQGHLDGLKKSLSVRENLAFYSRLWRSRAELEPLLAELHLGSVAHLPVRALSAGQRRRVCLAMLRVQGGLLWILDEPATNLDQQGRRLIGRWIESHLASGGLAIVATHQPDELLRMGSLLIEL